MARRRTSLEQAVYDALCAFPQLTVREHVKVGRCWVDFLIGRLCLEVQGAWTHTSPANAEADWFLSQVTDVAPGDILVVDMESPPKGHGDLSGWCLEWLYRVEARTGVRPWVYTGKWYAADAGRLTDAALGNYPLWAAAYGPTPPAPFAPWLQVILWQHTDGASYPASGCATKASLRAAWSSCEPSAGLGQRSS